MKITENHSNNIDKIILNKDGEVPAAKINLNLNSKRTVYIETDGCQINTTEGWKECKTFMLFETEKISTTDYRLKNKFYFSTMGNVGELKRQLKYHVERYCGIDEVRIICIGDGAKWIWNTCKELFPEEKYSSGIIEIIDFYHAVEKIGDLEEEKLFKEEKWITFFEDSKKYLQNGNIEMIEQSLGMLKDCQTDMRKRTIINEKLHYFMENKHRMRYSSYRAKDLCIGSGAIESANKFVVQRRIKLQGMIWKEENANYMAHLRAEYINGQLDSQYGIKSNPLLTSVT
jgi:hypothetical protein